MSVYRGKPLNPELVKAASAVASSLPRDKKQTESELLAQLRRHEETTDKQKKGRTINIRSVYWLFFSIMLEILIFNVILKVTAFCVGKVALKDTFGQFILRINEY